MGVNSLGFARGFVVGVLLAFAGRAAPAPDPTPPPARGAAAACVEEDLEGVTRCELWALAEEHRTNVGLCKVELKATREKLAQRTREAIRQLVELPPGVGPDLEGRAPDMCPSTGFWIGTHLAAAAVGFALGGYAAGHSGVTVVR